MQIIGHRGAAGLAKENTIEAIQKAIDCRVDMIEVDVRMQQGKIILSHNETTTQQEYTSLEEALAYLNGQTPLNLDIKESIDIKQLKQILKSYSGEVILSSRRFNILNDINNQISDPKLAFIENWSGIRAVAAATLLHTNRIHINQHWLWASFVSSIKNRGFSLYAYTVNAVERASELESWGIDGIFTDFPDRFK